MAGRSQTSALALGALFALTLSSAIAQALPRLHVPSFSLRADTMHPQIEKPFHLIINAHFQEQLASVDFVVLPNLAELEDLGDERHTIAGPRGTDFSETITVIAHHSGRLHVDPVYFDAIDARDGKPKRFSSNDLVLMVEGGTLEDPLAGIRHGLITAGKMLAILVAVFVTAAIVFRRRARSIAPLAPPENVLPAPVITRSPKDILSGHLDALRANRTRASVMQMRAALWAVAGANEGETLGDALSKLDGRSPELHPVLRLTERAGFIADAYLQGAIDDMILALEKYLA